MTQSLLDLLASDHDGGTRRIYGVVSAVVTNNQDPDGRGRVRLRFPWLAAEGEGESWWARIAAPMAGPDRGAYFLPEVDDEVLVAFEQGDVRFPYVLGALWNANALPPETNEDKKNNKRTIKSRSGHILRFDDTDGAEKIEIVDAGEKNSIVIDTKEQTITISAEKDLTIASAGGKLVLKAANGVEISSDANVSANAGGAMELIASAKSTLKGSTVEIN